MASCPACKRPLPTLRGLQPALRDEIAFELGMGDVDRATGLVREATGLSAQEVRAYLACPHAVPAAQPPPVVRCPACGRDLAFDAAQVVAAAIAEGRKIEAIKIVRETTGLGLARAKALVECPHDPTAVVEGPAGHGSAAPPRSKLVVGCLMAITILMGAVIAVVFMMVQHRRQDQALEREHGAQQARLCPDCKGALPDFPNASEADRAAVLDHIRFARKISAIKLVRERTGWGLKEAKAFVDCPHRVP